MKILIFKQFLNRSTNNIKSSLLPSSRQPYLINPELAKLFAHNAAEIPVKAIKQLARKHTKNFPETGKVVTRVCQ